MLNADHYKLHILINGQISSFDLFDNFARITANGKFEWKQFVALGEVYYVVEAYNERVQLVDSGGRGLVHWPIAHSVAYDGPHLVLAADGTLLITAPEAGAIQRFSPDGRLLDQWTQAGPTPLCRPVGIYLDEDTHTLYVTDTACHQVHVFEVE